jgi:hypothetical protein
MPTLRAQAVENIRRKFTTRALPAGMMSAELIAIRVSRVEKLDLPSKSLM